MMLDRESWVNRYAAALGVAPPTLEEQEEILAMAGAAAHASERTSAPLSAWIAGQAGVEATAARAVAVMLEEEAIRSAAGTGEERR
jgi:hypothetical protein